jgi:hypothetical protein
MARKHVGNNVIFILTTKPGTVSGCKLSLDKSAHFNLTTNTIMKFSHRKEKSK